MKNLRMVNYAGWLILKTFRSAPDYSDFGGIHKNKQKKSVIKIAHSTGYFSLVY